ncbi:protein translocase subunit secY/sec61 alpha [Herbinix hemicellulosilytica]|uniref:Protein translocase subunit SecY n=1 Tax=Herbinix hemicellulosilytica TaxID=1564487 RepID=A0A0H5SIA7_HERHM|nr:preprotein translocase subunit SecY [Herbinix hemicellulosilytica]RBP59849.1 protein translocase subunit secY/sec61 alpha [Herbinix hemicellulosilytica]CRZ35237.1 putative membrane protein [Herbinix hemicellulosilytica]HPU63244.1 preprotein translocase subunit SecY [Mobilitalea sp.]
MFKTFRNALKIKEIRTKLLYTLVALVIVRLGTLLPAPAISREAVEQVFSNINLGFLGHLTGGSFSRMSIFALSISPYISASIILQLLTIAIPKLEEMQKEGEDGRQKMEQITRYMAIGLAVIESAAMAIGFGSSSGILEGGLTFTNVVLVVASFTAGSAFLMWLGERITDRGIGNGISIILLFNIVSTMPADFINLYYQFVYGQPVWKAIIAVVVTLAVIIFTIVFVIILQDAERKIPVQYAKKVQGRKMVGGQTSHIPLKVNTAGVIPVIFTSSLMSFPGVIASFFGVYPARAYVIPKILKVLDQSSWLNINFKNFDFGEFKYSIGLLIYIGFIIFFAYFYTSITFNPIEIANNMKKQGGFIPGIRPGKPTSDYLNKVLNRVIFIGAVGLIIVSVIPIFFSGAFGAHVSFGGTSIIIIVGVIIETIKEVESQMLVRHYKGFLSD